MCPPPCGPRRRSTVDHVKSEKISKSEVEAILTSGDFVCLYRMGNETTNLQPSRTTLIPEKISKNLSRTEFMFLTTILPRSILWFLF